MGLTCALPTSIAFPGFQAPLRNLSKLNPHSQKTTSRQDKGSCMSHWYLGMVKGSLSSKLPAKDFVDRSDWGIKGARPSFPLLNKEKSNSRSVLTFSLRFSYIVCCKYFSWYEKINLRYEFHGQKKRKKHLCKCLAIKCRPIIALPSIMAIAYIFKSIAFGHVPV